MEFALHSLLLSTQLNMAVLSLMRTSDCPEHKPENVLWQKVLVVRVRKKPTSLSLEKAKWTWFIVLQVIFIKILSLLLNVHKNHSRSIVLSLAVGRALVNAVEIMLLWPSQHWKCWRHNSIDSRILELFYEWMKLHTEGCLRSSDAIYNQSS